MTAKFVALLMGLCVCSPILNAQAKPISRSQEGQVTCVVDLEPPPMTPYGFAMATLKSLGSARDAVNERTREPDESADNPLTLVTGMMRDFKLSTNDFICAKRAVQPFTNKAALSSLTPDQRKNIATAAAFMVSTYDKKIAINDQVLQLFKKLVGNGNGNMAQFSDQISTLQVEGDQTWGDLVVPVAMSASLLVDLRATDENGNFIQTTDPNVGQTRRLVMTKAQKRALLDWINEHFPELKDGTPEDKIADPAKTATLYLKVFDGRLCSDEPATIPAGN